VKERPILMRPPMIRALLEGKKTQTRRAVKPQPKRIEDAIVSSWDSPNLWHGSDGNPIADHTGEFWRCPYGNAGDKLWVREAFGRHESIQQVCGYVADGWKRTEKWERTIAAAHMPRWAARIELDIKDVRVQRLQEISEEDAI
jgi:hypothetical protein